jgi:hypothetical protein
VTVVGSVVVGSVGCASASVGTVIDDDAVRAVSVPAQPRVVELVDRPRSPAAASMLLAEASDALRRGDAGPAIVRIQALLRSDFLSDQGRANLYWLLAEAADNADGFVDVRQDALGGFLVAASVMDRDLDTVQKMRRAHSALMAIRVARRNLGSSPELAIVVASHTDADLVVRALPCGKDGEGRYVERRLPTSLRGNDVEPRRLLCSENGDERTLWFRVESDEVLR